MTHPEADLQIQIADLLRLHEKQRRFVFFCVPNELQGKPKSVASGAARMARFKRMGLRPGVADIVIVKEGIAYFLEIKSMDGEQSKDQLQFERDANSSGAGYMLVRTFDAALATLRFWKIIP